MRDELFAPALQGYDADYAEPNGNLQRALYLWERQPPSHAKPPVTGSKFPSDAQPDAASRAESLLADPVTVSATAAPTDEADTIIEDSLRDYAARLAALERIIPGDKRLDSARFSLMMLNAFLGRAVTDGAVLARLPGLMAICDRINAELRDLEYRYPDARDIRKEEPEQPSVLLRDEIRALFADLTSTQKAQQRQIVSSLSALHSVVADLHKHLSVSPDISPSAAPTATGSDPTAGEITGIKEIEMPKIDEFALPLMDSERLIDPRPVLAAARAAASRVTAELNRTAPPEAEAAPRPPERKPYRSVLLGSAIMGTLILLFGREAMQLISATPLTNALARP